MPIRTEISVASSHGSAPSSRCASVAAAAAAIALENTENVLSPSPLCLRSTPPCASTADAMSASWRASAESIGTGARSQSAVESTTSVSRKLSTPVGSGRPSAGSVVIEETYWTYRSRLDRGTESSCPQLTSQRSRAYGTAPTPKRIASPSTTSNVRRLTSSQGCSQGGTWALTCRTPTFAAWLEEQPPLPEWADRGRLSRGSAFFAEWGLQLGLGLFLSSLPLAYAAHDGVQVLALTAQLETDAKRRILESAQFVLDVTAPGALEPGRPGYETARLVRLMHAGVRHLIRTDPRVVRTSDASVWPRWDETWGEPINQEHLLGALISYSSSLLHVLDRLRIDYDDTAASDYCHLWNVVGWLLGIAPDLLPLERRRDGRDRAADHQAQPEEERGGHEDDGRAHRSGRIVHRHQADEGVAASTSRLFIGDETADLLDMPRADWTRYLVGSMRDIQQPVIVAGRARQGHAPVVARVSTPDVVGFRRSRAPR